MTKHSGIQVNEVVANKAREVGAEDWVRDLDGLVDSVLDDWGLVVGRQLDGGTEAWVAEVDRSDGSPAVLKMLVPRRTEVGLGGRAAELEAIVLAHTAGRGCAELYAHDLDRGALLMERLGPSLFDLGVPVRRQHEVMVGCASAMWRPPPDVALPSGAEKAQWLIEAITDQWEALDRPCSERTIDHAIRCGERRRAAHDPERAVLVHGDIHQWNTLRTLDGTGYKLIDPDGLAAEPEYDLGILMREDPVDLMQGDPWRRAAWLADQTDLDAQAIWQWGVIERVSTGLLCLAIGLQPVGDQMLAAAERISR